MGTSCPTLYDKRVGSFTSPADHNIEGAFFWNVTPLTANHQDQLPGEDVGKSWLQYNMVNTQCQ